jgi:hypothetical protein
MASHRIWLSGANRIENKLDILLSQRTQIFSSKNVTLKQTAYNLMTIPNFTKKTLRHYTETNDIKLCTHMPI